MSFISKNRKFLMGVAILLIIFCHNSIQLGAEIWKRASQIAQCGVDIFFLLSGFGLYYSYSTRGKYGSFIKKRFSVIIPPYMLVVISYSIVVIALGLFTVRDVIGSFSLITFYTSGNLSEWYLAAICLLYILFPLFYKIAKNDKVFWTACVLLWGSAVFLNLTVSYIYNIKVLSEIFIVRIPIFVIGIRLARWEIENENKKLLSFKASLVAVAVFAVASFCMLLFLKRNTWVWVRMLFCPLSISICYLLSYLRPKLNKCTDEIISYLGGITFWLYLLHVKVLYLLNMLWIGNFLNPIWKSLVINVVAIFLSVGISVGLSKVLQFGKMNIRLNKKAS